MTPLARRDANDREPVFWHAHPAEVDEDLAHNFPLVIIIDMVGASPNLAMVSIRKRIPYFGFCFSECHVKELTKEIERQTFKAMKKEV